MACPAPTPSSLPELTAITFCPAIMSSLAPCPCRTTTLLPHPPCASSPWLMVISPSPTPSSCLVTGQGVWGLHTGLPPPLCLTWACRFAKFPRPRGSECSCAPNRPVLIGPPGIPTRPTPAVAGECPNASPGASFAAATAVTEAHPRGSNPLLTTVGLLAIPGGLAEFSNLGGALSENAATAFVQFVPFCLLPLVAAPTSAPPSSS